MSELHGLGFKNVKVTKLLWRGSFVLLLYPQLPLFKTWKGGVLHLLRRPTSDFDTNCNIKIYLFISLNLDFTKSDENFTFFQIFSFFFRNPFLCPCPKALIIKFSLCCNFALNSSGHGIPMSHFYTPWKRQKTFGFLTFSGGIEMGHWTKMG